MVQLRNKGKVGDKVKVRITEGGESITRTVKPETLNVLKQQADKLNLKTAEELIYQLEGEKDSLRELPLSLIEFPEFNVPKRFLESIEEHGILEPPIVEPLGNGRYRVIAGRRRLNAARLLGFDTVKCIVKKGGDSTVLTLVENFHRTDNPALEAQLIAKLIEERNLKKSEVARLLNVSPAHITKRLRLLNLIPEIFEKLKRFEINITVARELARLKPEEQREYLNNPESRWTVEDVERFVKQKKIESSARLALSQVSVELETPAIDVDSEKILNPQAISSSIEEERSTVHGSNKQPVNGSLIKDMEELRRIAETIKILARDNRAIVENANRLLKIADKYLPVEV